MGMDLSLSLSLGSQYYSAPPDPPDPGAPSTDFSDEDNSQYLVLFEDI